MMEKSSALDFAILQNDFNFVATLIKTFFYYFNVNQEADEQTGPLIGHSPSWECNSRGAANALSFLGHVTALPFLQDVQSSTPLPQKNL